MSRQDPQALGCIADGKYLWRRFDDRREVETYADDGVTVLTSDPYDAEENAAADARAAQAQADATRATLTADVKGALGANVSYLAGASTGTPLEAQVVALTKQVDALIHIVVRLLGDASGT